MAQRPLAPKGGGGGGRHSSEPSHRWPGHAVVPSEAGSEGGRAPLGGAMVAADDARQAGGHWRQRAARVLAARLWLHEAADVWAAASAVGAARRARAARVDGDRIFRVSEDVPGTRAGCARQERRAGVTAA